MPSNFDKIMKAILKLLENRKTTKNYLQRIVSISALKNKKNGLETTLQLIGRNLMFYFLKSCL